MWLTGKDKLRKEDQQFGDWLHVEQFKPFQKSVVVIVGSSRSPSKWKKGPSLPCEQAFDPLLARPDSLDLPLASVMDSDLPLQHFFPVSTTSNLHLAPIGVLRKNRRLRGYLMG